MKCPHCDAFLLAEAESCSACGFDAQVSSSRHGDHWVRLDRLTDAAHCLRLSERGRLEARLDDFERRFPQVFFAVYFGVLPQGLKVLEVGFWLLNHAAFGTHDIAKRNEFGVVLVIDPAAGAAAFSLGYAIEVLADKINAGSILNRMRRALARSDYGNAVEGAISDLDKRLRFAGRSQFQDARRSTMHAVSSDLGFSPLRNCPPESAAHQERQRHEADRTRNSASRAGRSAMLGAIAWLTIAQSALSADIDTILPLPRWSETAPGDSRLPEAHPILGGYLLPDGMLHADELAPSPGPQQQPLLATEFQAASPADDLSLFLPDALLGKAIRPYQQPGPTPAGSLRFLDDDFLTTCRSAPGDEHLIDPDSHVSETQKEDLLRFLQFHARDARIDAYVVVTDRDQSVPQSADLSGIASGALEAQDSCLAVYPLGEPWRARLFVSTAIHKLTPADYLKSLVDDCAKDALLVTDPLEQLHRFTVRLSIRLFWLEKMIGADQKALAQSGGENIPADIIARREAALAAALIEHDAHPGRQAVQGWSVVLGILISLAGGGATYAALRYRRKRLFSYVWMLPEIDIPPRLGGAFTGGGGAWIQFR